MTAGVARSACEAQDTWESLVPGMTGTVSPQLPNYAQLPVGTGWSSVRGSLCALLLAWGRGSQAVLGDKDTSQGSQCHLVGDKERSGATRAPAPGAEGTWTFPARAASSSPIPTEPCSIPGTTYQLPSHARSSLEVVYSTTKAGTEEFTPGTAR